MRQHDITIIKSDTETHLLMSLRSTFVRDTFTFTFFTRFRLGGYTGLVWYQYEAKRQRVSVNRLCTTNWKLLNGQSKENKGRYILFVYFSTLWDAQTCLSLHYLQYTLYIQFTVCTHTYKVLVCKAWLILEFKTTPGRRRDRLSFEPVKHTNVTALQQELTKLCYS